MNKTAHKTLLAMTKTSLIPALLAAVLPACGSSPPDLTGHWVSAAVETRPSGSGGNLYLRRDFKTTATTSAAMFSFFADAAGTQPTVVVWLNGPYTLSAPWDPVPGSYAGEFTFTELKITPKSQAFVDLLNGSAPGTCGASWKLGMEQTLTGTAGCLTLGIDLKNKSVEYDIVKREGDRLYYGARPADGTGLDTKEKRPTALQVPVVLAP